MASEHAAGHETVVLELRGELNRTIVQKTLDTLEERHELWRTRYLSQNSTLVARVDPPRGITLDPVSVQEDQLRLEIDRFVRKPFDFEKEAAIRIILFELKPDHHALLVVCHHASCDGHSLFAQFPREFASLYHALRNSTSVEEHTNLSFSDYARIRNAADSESHYQEDKEFWLKELDQAPAALDLPTDYSRPASRSLRGERTYRDVSSEVQTTLHSIAKNLEVRPLDIALTALALLLRAISDQDEFCIGVMHANRRDDRIKNLFGCLIRTLPIRCSIDEKSTFRELVHAIHQRRKRAFAHLDGSDDAIAELFPKDSSRQSGYQVVLNYMPFSERGVEVDGLVVHAWRPDPGWTGTDLAFDIVDEEQGMRCVLERDATLFDIVTADAWFDAFLHILGNVESSTETLIRDFSFLSEDALSTLRTLGKGGGPPVRSTTLVNDLRLSVEGNANRPATISGTSILDYQTLWQRSKSLGARIAQLSPKTSTPTIVGFSTQDPINSVIAMLGAWIGNAAYVPLDPSLPQTRLEGYARRC